ncbi:MAG TPA: DUF6352 family protein [Alphaproteobacteria bacterium]|nr:DUF6352 family protein [Alphaproteobacteria bacterium]
MPDFWRSSGFHLLEPASPNRLKVTNGFLRAYLMRPEIRPVSESCTAERGLHAALLDEPRRPVAAAEVSAIVDPDARENYAIWLAFRDRLLAAGSVEDAYLGLFVNPAGDPVPPLFVDQLAHVVVRAMLQGTAEPLRARAGEMFFRPQKVTINDGAIMVADEEVVEMYASSGGMGSLGRLIVDSQTPVRTVDLDVLSEHAADEYWRRDERYDTVLDLSFGRPGLDALARVLEAWVARFLAIDVAIQPVRTIKDDRWVWHVGLDSEASAIMNDLYDGREVDEARLARIISLFRLEFAEPSVMRPDIAGRPVYLGLGMDTTQRLRLKPQNLLVNLPLAASA